MAVRAGKASGCKVYAVYDATMVLRNLKGIFSSLSLAQEYVIELSKKTPVELRTDDGLHYDFGVRGAFGLPEYHIEPVVVDKERVKKGAHEEGEDDRT